MCRLKKYAIIFLPVLFFSCKKTEENNINAYLDPWIGAYEGTAHRYTSYPDSNWNYIINESYPTAFVDVRKSDADSSLHIMIAYDNVPTDTADVYFSAQKIHSEEWGGGSSYGYLTIELAGNSFKYHRFQKCGIPCSSGIDFDLEKN